MFLVNIFCARSLHLISNVQKVKGLHSRVGLVVSRVQFLLCMLGEEIQLLFASYPLPHRGNCILTIFHLFSQQAPRWPCPPDKMFLDMQCRPVSPRLGDPGAFHTQVFLSNPSSWSASHLQSREGSIVILSQADWTSKAHSEHSAHLLLQHWSTAHWSLFTWTFIS